MNFRTEIKIEAERPPIMHYDSVMLLGSCFSNNVGAMLRDAMFDVVINPFGTIYNPFSIGNAVERLVFNRPVTTDDLFEVNGVWSCFDFHTLASNEVKSDAIAYMNSQISDAHRAFARAATLIITLGTAIVYEYVSTGKVVNNCHRLPSSCFNRRFTSVDEITEELNRIVALLHNFNPELRIIFTISPVRHVADGMEQNLLSKSVLRVAVDSVIKQYPQKCQYFPAYEIMVDDLRDYRFYGADMVHPSDVAIDYIWQMFKARYFDQSTMIAVEKSERLTKRLAHRPMTENYDMISKFNRQTVEAIRRHQSEYPYLSNNARLNNILEKL